MIHNLHCIVLVIGVAELIDKLLGRNDGVPSGGGGGR